MREWAAGVDEYVDEKRTKRQGFEDRFQNEVEKCDLVTVFGFRKKRWDYFFTRIGLIWYPVDKRLIKEYYVY